MKPWPAVLPVALLAAGFAWAAPATSTSSAVALSEMQALSQAMDFAAFDTLYYVTPETLNDSASTADPSSLNYINREGGTFVIPPATGTFRPSGRLNLLTAALPWRGPYITYQLGRTQAAPTPYDVGSPLDPWGSPYLLFSPLGLLRGDTGSRSLEYYGDQFDRYTLVSLGPDGVRSADDLLYQFGPAVTVFALSSVRAAGSTVGGAASSDPGEPVFIVDAGSTVTIRGLNLGASRDGATVWFGSTELTAVARWSAREVDVSLPAALAGRAMLRIERGAASSAPLDVQVLSGMTAAVDWALYR